MEEKKTTINEVSLSGAMYHPKEIKAKLTMASASMSLSVRQKDGKYAPEYINLLAFSDVATKLLATQVKSIILVKGKLSINSYVNAEGVTIKATQIIVNELSVVSPPIVYENNEKSEAHKVAPSKGNMDFADSDIPF